jgi:hypothetical protein
LSGIERKTSSDNPKTSPDSKVIVNRFFRRFCGSMD